MILFTSVMTSSEDHPATYPMNTEALSPEIMLLEQGHEHPLPSTADNKNACKYTNTPYAFIVF
jgi:hypothetical protein